MLTAQQQTTFDDVVKFHGCYCLDIAIGFRVTNALVREMGDDMNDMKKIYGYTGTPTCAVDAFQLITGCTPGKRNLVYTHTGKPTYTLQNVTTGKAIRAYVHYWDQFDHTELQHKKKQAKETGTPQAKQALQQLLDDEIHKILQAPEQDLFRITPVTLSAPPRSGKYLSAPCAQCGEYTKRDLLVKQEGGALCKECINQTTLAD